jgi:lipopolysaccharide transport system permease protein
VYGLYADGSKGAMRSIRRNAGMIKKVYVPKYLYSFGKVLSEFVFFLISLIVLFVVMIATNAEFTWYILLAVVPIFILVVFTLGTGLLLATLTVFFRDVEYLYGVFLMMLMWASAIFYPASIVPAQYQFLLKYNPLYAIITLTRDCFLYGRIFDPKTLIFAAGSAAIVFILGVILFYKYQDKFILYI